MSGIETIKQKVLDEAKKISQNGWRTVRFGDVVRNVDSSVKNPLEQGIERFVGLEHLDPESLHVKRWGNVADGTSFSRKFASGQVLFGKRRAYQRKAAVADFDGICSGDILVFEPKTDELLPELLPFVVQSDGFFEHALGTSAGSLSPRTKWSDMARYEFALPPKDEQRRIAEILWAIETETRCLENVSVQLEINKKVLIESLIEKGISNQHTNGWKKAKIGDLGDVVTGATPDTKKREFYGNEYMFVAPADISDSQRVEKTEKNITDAGIKVIRQIPEDSVMVVCIGSTIGKVAMTTKICATNQQINSVVCFEDCDPSFVYYLLKSKSEEFRKLSGCTAVPILNKSNFSKISVPKPPLSEQIKISNLVATFNKTQEEVKRKQKTVTELKVKLIKEVLENAGVRK